MTYWIDIEDANGVRQGYGPILNALAWTHTANLDRAGTFSFTLPADDPRRAALRVKRIARCWTYDGGALQHLGAGIINSISTSLTPEGAAIITVNGDDLLHELTYRGVGELITEEEVKARPSRLFYVTPGTEIENGNDTVGQTWLDQLTDNDFGDTTTWASLDWRMMNNWTLICDPHPFRQVTWQTSPRLNFKDNPATDPDGFVLQYWSNDSDGKGKDGWKDLTAEANTTGIPWSIPTYQLTWDIPSDWTIRSGEATYKLRFHPNYCHNGFDLADCFIVYDQPTTNALSEIMALAPTGWSLDVANGYSSITRSTGLGTNLIANGDFETYTGGQDNGDTPDTFAGWTITRSGTGTAEATATCAQGANALKLTNAGAGHYAYATQQIAVTGGIDYLLTMQSRGDGTREGPFYVTAIASVSQGITPIEYTGNATTTWREYRVDLKVPPAVTAINIRLLGPWIADHVSGTIYWDAVTLQPRFGGEVHLEFANETVLEALCRVAETTGEHFILSPSGRQVLWLRNDVRSTGVRCVGDVDAQAVETADELALIVSLTEDQSAYDLVSRVYPYGGGTGDERKTLADCTRGVPTGYTLNTAEGYLERDAAVTALGRIDKRLDFPDIVTLNDSPAQRQYASNMLLDRAYTYLRRHSCTDTTYTTGDVPRSYNLTLAKCDRALLPGYTVHVEYAKWYNGAKTIEIDRDLWILSATVQVDESGVHTVALQCSTTDVAPLTDAQLVAELLRKQRAGFAHAPGMG